MAADVDVQAVDAGLQSTSNIEVQRADDPSVVVMSGLIIKLAYPTKRIPADSKSTNPIASITDTDGKALAEGTDYTIAYYKSDPYGDLTAPLSGLPTEPGLYCCIIKPKNPVISGTYAAVAYQIVGDDHFERDLGKVDVTDFDPKLDAESSECYYVDFDPKEQWLHYTKDKAQHDKWLKAGYKQSNEKLAFDSVVYFAQNPNTGRYVFSYADYICTFQAWTFKGLTYNLDLCVQVAEASCVLNTGCDAVSDEEGYDVDKSKTWVSKEAYDDLKKAIAEAEIIGTTKGASSAQVSKASENLSAALAAFSPAKGKKGEKRSIAGVKVASVKSPTYSGKVVKQAPVVTANGKTLKLGKDYTIAYKNAKNKTVRAAKLKAAGTYKMLIKGKGYWSGTKTVKFKIKPVSIKSKKVKVTKIKTQKLKKAGKAVKPKVTVKFGKTKLKLGKDYKLTYKNNKKKGTAKVVIKGIGNFNKTKTVKFKIK